MHTTSLLADITKVSVSGVRDFNNNELSQDINVAYYKNGVVASVFSENDLKDASGISASYNANQDTIWLSGIDQEYTVDTKNQLKGIEDFSVNFGVETKAANINLVKFGNDVSLSIDNDGYVVFKVKDLTLSSKEEIQGGVPVNRPNILVNHMDEFIIETHGLFSFTAFNIFFFVH